MLNRTCLQQQEQGQQQLAERQTSPLGRSSSRSRCGALRQTACRPLGGSCRCRHGGKVSSSSRSAVPGYPAGFPSALASAVAPAASPLPSPPTAPPSAAAAASAALCSATSCSWCLRMSSTAPISCPTGSFVSSGTSGGCCLPAANGLVAATGCSSAAAGCCAAASGLDAMVSCRQWQAVAIISLGRGNTGAAAAAAAVCSAGPPYRSLLQRNAHPVRQFKALQRPAKQGQRPTRLQPTGPAAFLPAAPWLVCRGRSAERCRSTGANCRLLSGRRQCRLRQRASGAIRV